MTNKAETYRDDPDSRVAHMELVLDEAESKMVEGKREKSVPWWRLHRIAEELGGELKSYIIQDSRGNVTRKISIEYKEEELLR